MCVTCVCVCVNFVVERIAQFIFAAVHRVRLRITTRLSLLCLLALVRCAMFIIEQPQGSCMPKVFPYIRYLQKVVEHLGLTWDTCNLLEPKHFMSSS